MNATSICDLCEREMPKAHRVYQEKKYCAVCYSREFKRRLCQKCGRFARLPKSNPNAICTACELAKPCARCGKIHFQIGKLTPYGPVCNSCAPYFRKMEPCESCGHLSQKLTRVSRLGSNLRLCQKCARADYGTCQGCRRYRLLSQSSDGMWHCKNCREKGKIPCTVCGNPMPAGRGKSCESCYWTETFRKRIRIDQAAFSVPALGNAFVEFGNWLINKVGSRKAALTVHRYLPFFLVLEAKWQTIPSYSELLSHFEAEGLRRSGLAMRWLCEARHVVPNILEKVERSEKRRISSMLSSVDLNSPAAQVITAFKDELLLRVNAGKLSLRSTRQVLRPAVSLFLAADPAGRKFPDQSILDQYLRSIPGQMANLSVFLNFLKKAYGVVLTPRIDVKRAAKLRKKAIEKQLTKIMREENKDDEFLMVWVPLALEYFHQVPRRFGKLVQKSQVKFQNNDWIIVEMNEIEYRVPTAAFKFRTEP